MPANVIGLAHTPFFDHLDQRPGMVFHIQPVADLLAIAVHRQGLAIQGIQDHVRDELLRKLIRPVIVRAVGQQHR